MRNDILKEKEEIFVYVGMYVCIRDGNVESEEKEGKKMKVDCSLLRRKEKGERKEGSFYFIVFTF